jgi:lipoprotein-anchoring transpeptidase ErfK/SrfK
VAHQLGQGVSAGGRSRWQRTAQWTAAAAAVALLATACGGSSGNKSASTAPVANGQTASSAAGGDTPGGAASSSAAAQPMVLTANPADGAKGADPAKGIQISAANGKLESVTATDAAGKTVSGTMSADGASWASSGTLAVSSDYTVVTKAQDGSGAEKTTTSKFTTLTPQKRLGLDHYVPDDGKTVGVGEPVAVFFTNAPNEKDRANVEKAMTVTTTPHVDGAWSWRGATQVDWRPQSYWQPGTKVQVHLGLNGVKAGDTTYGTFTKDFSFTIGDATISTVDLQKDKMTVTQNGKTLRVIPVSGGIPDKHPTWSGKMVVLDKTADIEMKSQSVGFTDSADFYDMKIQYAVHLTESGTYVHAAPWRHADFGVDNVSHGCVGMDLEPAQWFFNLSKPGDIVEVLKSSQTKGNVTTNSEPGFDDWNLSWTQWLQGSATKGQSAQGDQNAQGNQNQQ